MKVNNKKIRDIILRCYNADPRCADDDKLLIAKVWYLHGWNDPELYNHIKDMPAPESITRARRKLVEEGLITPSKEVSDAREQQELQAKRDLGYNV